MKLTDEHIDALWFSDYPVGESYKHFARAIEAALTEKQEPYDKTEMNAFVQNLYDQKMREGKHGHYETMFHVVHQAIKRAHPAPVAEHGPVGEVINERGEVDWISFVPRAGTHLYTHPAPVNQALLEALKAWLNWTPEHGIEALRDIEDNATAAIAAAEGKV